MPCFLTAQGFLKEDSTVIFCVVFPVPFALGPHATSSYPGLCISFVVWCASAHYHREEALAEGRGRL